MSKKGRCYIRLNQDFELPSLSLPETQTPKQLCRAQRSSRGIIKQLQVLQRTRVFFSEPEPFRLTQCGGRSRAYGQLCNGATERDKGIDLANNQLSSSPVLQTPNM